MRFDRQDLRRRHRVAVAAAALFTLATVGCGALVHDPEVVEAASVDLPAGFVVSYTDTTACRGTGDPGWLWRDVIVESDLPSDEAASRLAEDLASKGFSMEDRLPGQDPGTWYIAEGSNGTIGVQIGTGEDFDDYVTIVDRNSEVARRARGSVLLRLRPEGADCEI